MSEHSDDRSGVFYEVTAEAEGAKLTKKPSRGVELPSYDLDAEVRDAYAMLHQEIPANVVSLQVPLGVLQPRGSLRITSGIMRNVLASDYVRLGSVQCRPADILNLTPYDERPHISE